MPTRETLLQIRVCPVGILHKARLRRKHQHPVASLKKHSIITVSISYLQSSRVCCAFSHLLGDTWAGSSLGLV